MTPCDKAPRHVPAWELYADRLSVEINNGWERLAEAVLNAGIKLADQVEAVTHG